eukprot:Anaeramoba_ignava/a349064_22.p2 GENE.a349064_22~~a349064_22.p2  ORF type:complete len:178 (+),score=6.66 a349064_22:827-1360(+)
MKKYIYIIAAAVLVFFIGQSVYQQVNKKSAKASRLECHKNSTVFEKVLNQNLLAQLQNDIKNGEIKVNINIEKAKYMKSKLFDFVDPENVQTEFAKLAGQKASADEPNSSVDILIYENDKNDPGKKTEKSKLYAGYLVFSFKVGNTLVYKLQIDFLDHEGKDISKVLECGLKSVLTI